MPAELFQILKDHLVKVLHSVCQKMWKFQQCQQDWKRSVFIEIPKKCNARECSKYGTVQLLSYLRLFVTSWTVAHQAPLSITNSQSLVKLTSIESVILSNHIILCGPILLLPLVFSALGLFQMSKFFANTWTKQWSFSFSISPSNSGLISFRVD